MTLHLPQQQRAVLSDVTNLQRGGWVPQQQMQPYGMQGYNSGIQCHAAPYYPKPEPQPQPQPLRPVHAPMHIPVHVPVHAPVQAPPSPPARRSRRRRCNDIAADVLGNLKAQERMHALPQDHLSGQPEITPEVRAAQVPWDLTDRFRTETKFLFVSILDRFLAKKTIERSKLRMHAVVALMLACKYEETHPPLASQFQRLTQCKLPELLACERDMLETLSFDLTVPSMWAFVTSFCLNDDRDEVMDAAKYIASCAAPTYSLCKYLPSVQAAACISLAHQALYGENWAGLEAVTGYTAADITACQEVFEGVMLQRMEAPVRRLSEGAEKAACVQVVREYFILQAQAPGLVEDEDEDEEEEEEEEPTTPPLEHVPAVHHAQPATAPVAQQQSYHHQHAIQQGRSHGWLQGAMPYHRPAYQSYGNTHGHHGPPGHGRGMYMERPTMVGAP